jgi:uncharacterized membrane protein YdbT with pleckstrin-like domain
MGSLAARRDRARPVKAPSSLRLNPGEEVLFHMRTHPKVLFGPAVFALLLVAAAVANIMFMPRDLLQGYLFWGPFAVLAYLALYYVWYPTASWKNSTFTITSKQIIVAQGLLYKKSHSTQLSRVSDIEVERGILDRIFRCGTLIVVNAANIQGGASDSMSRVVLRDVPRALDVETAIKDLVFHDRQDAALPAR